MTMNWRNAARDVLLGACALTLGGCGMALTGASILANHAAVEALSEEPRADVKGSDILKMANWRTTFDRKDSSIFSSVDMWTCSYTPPSGGVCVPEGRKINPNGLYGCTMENGGYLYCKQG